MNEISRSNVFIIQRESKTSLDPAGPMWTALTADLVQLRLIVKQARLVNSPNLERLEGLLAAREEYEGR